MVRSVGNAFIQCNQKCLSVVYWKINKTKLINEQQRNAPTMAHLASALFPKPSTNVRYILFAFHFARSWSAKRRARGDNSEKRSISFA